MRTNWPHANWRIEQTSDAEWPIRVYLQGFDGDIFVPTQVVDIANMGMTAGDAARMSWVFAKSALEAWWRRSWEEQ